MLIVVTEMLTDDWQLYCPPLEVWRGLNVRLPLDTVMPFSLVTTAVAFLHVTTGVSELFPTSVPVQVSVYICPATGVPEVVMFTVCTETEVKKKIVMRIATGNALYLPKMEVFLPIGPVMYCVILGVTDAPQI